MKILTAIVAGYGSRGSRYASFATQHPEQLEIVAVADPNPIRQKTAKELHNLEDSRIFDSWEQLAALPKMADFAIVATQDSMHVGPALALIEKGYHLLLEKPMAPTPWECEQITLAAERTGVQVVVCHVLRFTQFWRAIKDVILAGKLGKILNIVHMENVGHIHQSHSFVRGNWSNSERSSCMLLQKSCHDMDILQWLLGEQCEQVQSFGGLHHFCRENMPEGAPDRCVKGCPVADTCHYNAKKLYFDDKNNLWFRSVAAQTIDMPTDEQVMEAITYGPYGRCVYQCDNDVVDHQVVSLQLEDDATAVFTMTAFTPTEGRCIRLMGTDGEIYADMERNIIRFRPFGKPAEEIAVRKLTADFSGHGGGDVRMVADYLDLLEGKGMSAALTTISRSVESHVVALAAEESRLNGGQVIPMDEFAKR